MTDLETQLLLDRIVELEEAVHDAQHLVGFLHGCLTDRVYDYAYPEQTLAKLARWERLSPAPEGCVHSRLLLEDCQSCRDHYQRMIDREGRRDRERVTIMFSELRCAYCTKIRPNDDEPCPHCQRPRFHHKTRPGEFQERMREIEEHDRD